MSVSIEDFLYNHGLGSGGSGVPPIYSETEPTGDIKDLTIWYRRSDGQSKIYLDGAFRSFSGSGGTILTPIIGHITTNTVTGTIAIPIANFNPEKDILFVTQNSVQLTLGIDYRLNKNTKTIEKISGQWNTRTLFTFMVIANTTAPSSDSISLTQFEDNVQVAAGLTNIGFNVSAFNAATDILQVYRNNQAIFRTIDWSLNPNGRSIDLMKATATNDRFHFVVLKKIRDVLPTGGGDGSLLADGTVSTRKLNFAPITTVNGQLPDSSGDVSFKADRVQIVDEGDFFTGGNIESALQEVGRTTQDFKILRSNKDSKGLFRRIELRDKATNKLYQTSVLSGGTAPNYTTRTLTYYEEDGMTIKKTVSFALSYDGDGDIVSEV